MKKLGVIGLIGRFRPLHNGGALLLEHACKSAKKVIIGIGSANKYDSRNPFTPEETKEMIDSFLGKRFHNYTISFIPDYGHLYGAEGGKLWRDHVVREFGTLDYFLTGNAYVKELLKRDYKIVDPLEIIPKEKQHEIRATMVRTAMAEHEDWEHLVPKEVADYLNKKKLVERFRKEFAKEMLEDNKGKKISGRESLEIEKAHTLH